METTEQGSQGQALEPVEQETIEFHNEQVVAVRLADGRIAVVLRWVCASLRVDSHAQVRRIQRTGATASELVRVRVQTPGGRQVMPAITLRGFSPWVLGISPNEVKSDNPAEEERIRALIIAYQEEAKDVLYEHFVRKGRAAALPGPAIVPAEPMRPGPEATRAERIAYYEDLEVWARWKANQEAQEWRADVEEWRGSVESQLEGDKAMLALIPEIIDRFGPEKLTAEHQQLVQFYVNKLHEATSKHQNTIHVDLRTAFKVPRYQDILEDDWPKVENWFRVQMERTRKKPGR